MSDVEAGRTKASRGFRPRARALRRARRRGRRVLVGTLRRGGWARSRRDRNVPVPGVVDEFTRVLAAGWVAVPPGAAPVRVSLHIGRVEVASTWATAAGPAGPDPAGTRGPLELRTFRFKVRGIWRYAKRTHRITVRADGQPLPIVGHGMFLRPERSGRGTPAMLAERLAAGHVFSQTGSLQLSRKLDLEWQEEVLALYEGVCRVLREEFDHDAFVIYGSLLGAVRERGFIGHDLDFDAAYLSRHTDPAAAAEELQAIALRLIDAGFDVDCVRIALHIHAKSDPAIRIDLFHLFFDAEGVLSFPFGVAGTRAVRKEEWRGVEQRDFGDNQVLAPVCAEAVVEAIYGATWREPNPGFSWARDRRHKAAGAFVPPDGVAQVYWANLHSRSDAVVGGSPFAAALLDLPDLPDAVVDLGSGDGRDSLAFAAAGRTVLGLDRCPVGLRRARERAEQAGLTDLARFTACDLADTAAVRAAVGAARESAGEAPLLYYARFLFHAVPPEVQDGLLAEIAAAARPGDLLAAEFRVLADEPLPKLHRRAPRRFQDGPAFGRLLAGEHGFEVLDEWEGTGLSPYAAEDPVLYRLLARRR